MIALVELTKPGPFSARTHELGTFLGIRVDGQLVAMTGERMKPGNYTEMTAVCVHPDHRGRGYAQALLGAVARQIARAGRDSVPARVHQQQFGDRAVSAAGDGNPPAAACDGAAEADVVRRRRTLFTKRYVHDMFSHDQMQSVVVGYFCSRPGRGCVGADLPAGASAQASHKFSARSSRRNAARLVVLLGGSRTIVRIASRPRRKCGRSRLISGSIAPPAFEGRPWEPAVCPHRRRGGGSELRVF